MTEKGSEVPTPTIGVGMSGEMKHKEHGVSIADLEAVQLLTLQ